MSNLDRFILGTMPLNLESGSHSLTQFIKSYHQVSINGLQVELFDDRSESQSFIYTFIPTLSSLYFESSNKNVLNNCSNLQSMMSKDFKSQKIIEFHESQPIFKRKPLSHSLVEQCCELSNNINKLDLLNLDASSSNSNSSGSISLKSKPSSDLLSKHNFSNLKFALEKQDKSISD